MFKYILGLIILIAFAIIYRHRDIFISKLSIKISFKEISIDIENKQKKHPSTQD